MFGQTIARWLMAFISPQPAVGILYLPRFLSDWHRYRKQSKGGSALWRDSHPCLTDWTAKTPFDPHYFYQAAWLARALGDVRPDGHVDVGSSVYMHSVLSAFVPTTFVDYRPLMSRITGLRCIGGDITRLPFADQSLQSLSCLHVIEHVGLGRYGDRINPMGSRDAAKELQRVVAPKGRLYLSVPVGRERVCFNAHRVHEAETVVSYFQDLQSVSFSLVDDQGQFIENAPLAAASGLDYGCGMFEFSRPGL